MGRWVCISRGDVDVLVGAADVKIKAIDDAGVLAKHQLKNLDELVKRVKTQQVPEQTKSNVQRQIFLCLQAQGCATLDEIENITQIISDLRNKAVSHEVAIPGK